MLRTILICAAALVAFALAACGDDPPSSTPTATPTSAFDADTTETLDLVARRTEELFTLASDGAPEISLIDDAALESLVDELLADPEAIESIRRDQAFYSLFGLIDPDTDLLALNEELLIAGIAGLYRPEIDHLYVRLFGSFSSLEESTASHEYAHYLQDAHFDLDAMTDAVAGDRDAELAISALFEGDAAYVQQQYIAEYFNQVQLFSMTFGGIVAAAESPSVPYVLTRLTTFVYLDGQQWLGGLLDDGYDRTEVYANPPRSTRAILHPETYGEPVVRVDLRVNSEALPSGWTAGEPETIGELMLSIWLTGLSARETAADADGWLADQLRVFHRGADPVGFVARLEWETPEDSVEFVDVTSEALDADGRYERAGCNACTAASWFGPAGLLSIEAIEPGSTLLVLAPSVAEVQQLIEAVR